MGKISLHGFNNLTKTLSFNIYDISYVSSDVQIQKYINYVDNTYSAENLTQTLKNVAKIIGATILNTAKADYDPFGASVTMLISEEESRVITLNNDEKSGPLPRAVVTHLDKSHITVHTYPESHPVFGITTFRADIDISTCGMISPLKALNFLLHSFKPDVVIADYRVRGFTRDTTGNKHYIDHKVNSISNYIDQKTKNKYKTVDLNIFGENIFHTKMLLKDFNLNNYLFHLEVDNLSPKQQESIEKELLHEMNEIFYSKNIRLHP